jgi:rhodanese-related sulfurtransferase/glyoxylase-like metal-dependent hydrolase (beta-lactamase superfamily II)
MLRPARPTLAAHRRPDPGDTAQRHPPSIQEKAVIFTQYYLDCLSHASYLIGDETTGRAVVVDPRRDVGEYLADAQAQQLRIVGVINTHFHADFLAGHLELADATGAWIGYGPRAATEYPIRHLADGERIVLGDVVLEITQTPGHTPESISIQVFTQMADPVPYGVLTGDALFIGDVGRPDLLASNGHTADELGRMLHSSIRRLMALADDVRVFPAHGAGSACGKNLSTQRWSTIGSQRTGNYACQPMDENEFVALVTADQPPTPDYFAYDAEQNRKNHPVFDPTSHPRPLELPDVLGLRRDGAVVVDARDPQEFATGHLAGSLNVPIDGRFAETAGTVVRPGQQILIVAPQNREAEIVTRLARIGLDRVTGYLREPENAFLTAPESTARASRLTAAQLVPTLHNAQPALIDVRNPGELAAGAIPGARRIPLAQLPTRLADLPQDQPIIVYCASGYRSSVAAAFLRREGYPDVSDLLGGYRAWTALTQPVA